MVHEKYITMKKILFAALFAVALCGCAGHSHNEEAVADEHLHINSYTAYTQKTEFFLQHEGLTVGERSCITLYATSLHNFKPVAHEKAVATMRVNGKTQEQVAVAQQIGVFHFDITPEAAGSGMLYIEAGGERAHFDITVNEEHSSAAHSHDGHAHSHAHEGHNHNHDSHAHSGHSHNHSHEGHSHSHEGHAHSHSSHPAHPGHGVETNGKPGDVTLTKEQTWKIDFATAVAAESNLGGTVKVAARVEALPSNYTTVVATTSGKVQFASNVVEGSPVKSGESLFYLEGSDVTDNDASVKFAEAESNYHLAKADFERKKHLFTDKIVSEREYQAAEALYLQAEARYKSMQRNFGGGVVTLRSVMDGYVAALLVANGDYVEPGTPLATVQRNGNVNIVAELPVRYAAQLQNVAGVNVELPSGKVLSVEELGGGLQAVGSAANRCNMLPVTVACPQMEGVVPGSIVTLYISSSSGASKCVAVPRTALVEEMGKMFVFVQNSPVSFEKRLVEAGATDGNLVQLLSGVEAGERVVTKGGVILKLSQGAAALDPHAGHVH